MERGKFDLTHFINESYYPITEDKIKNIAIQILEGIKAVHSVNVIHRDLKPSNLIIRENGSIALCDFGSAV
jgi:mitogen-activated protein kinase 1/3